MIGENHRLFSISYYSKNLLNFQGQNYCTINKLMMEFFYSEYVSYEHYFQYNHKYLRADIVCIQMSFKKYSFIQYHYSLQFNTFENHSKLQSCNKLIRS